MRPTGRAARPRLRAQLVPRRAALAVLTALTAAASAAAQPGGGSKIGLHPTLPALIERREAREQGRRITVGLNANARSPFLRDQDPRQAPDVVYSPWTETVYEVGGPGWTAAAPEYYVVDGAYLAYDPPDFSDPSVHVRAVPREEFQSLRIDAARNALYDARQRSSFSAEKKGMFTPGSGLTVNVPIQMKGALSEFFGRGATSIKVTGRENISFAGESRVISPFIQSERGRGQSLFPRLDMKQELQVKLDGTIGDKVHVQVDHNSSGFGADANRINIYYQGYDDDILRRIDLGGTNLSLPGSSLVSFSGGRRGLFGIKTNLRLGELDVTLIASKEEADSETRTLNPGGGTARPSLIAEKDYQRDRFFFIDRPDTTGLTFPQTYGIPLDSLLDESAAANIRVFVDTGTNPSNSNYTGFAVADLQGKDEDGMVAQYTAAGPTGRWPEDPPSGGGAAGDNAFWKPVDPDEIGFVKLEFNEGANGTRRRVLGFYFRSGAVASNVSVGVVVEGAAGRFGSLDVANRKLRMRLVRHRDQDANFANYPSAAYMMRHVYALGSQGITHLELRIASDDPNRVPSDVPQNIPNSTYLHMFGLDDLNEQNGSTPDGKFDIQDRNRLNPEEGLLFLPGIRPFSPTVETIRDRLLSAGIPPALAARADSLFPESERVASTLYTLRDSDQRLPRARYHIEAVTTGTETEITLPQDIIENSDVVKLDGQTLTRGVDYDIDPVFGGRITLKGDALARITPTSKIEVTYQYRPMFGGGKSSLVGMSAEYELGNRGKFASVVLYQATGAFNRRPKLGEEPSRALVADVNGSLRFSPRWMTRLLNVLPFTNTNAPSAITLLGEAAVSVPNPNTRKIAFVDDLEGADDSDEQNLSRNSWAWASIPIDDPVRYDRTPIGGITRPDTLLRVPVAFYNPPSERVRRGYLNPKLSENEIRDGLNVMEIGFDRQQFAALDTLASQVGRRDWLWSGIMRSFGAAPLDLTRTKSIEFWFNDGEPNPINRSGKLHIDFGRISENFVFFPERRFLGDPEYNREAELSDQFQVQSDDTGWDHVQDVCPQDKDVARSLPFNSDCYVPSAENNDRQFFLANGTAGNLVFDTEDLNGNQQFESNNSYFGLTIDLHDPTFVISDVSQEFGEDPTVPADIRREINRQGWRKYRIELPDSLPVFSGPGEAAPDRRRIQSMRFWFEDAPGTSPAASLFNRNLQLYGLRLNRNQWFDLGFGRADSTAVARPGNAEFTVGVINNKDDLNYELPPATTDIDDQGVQARQQSLRLAVNRLPAGAEVSAERSLGGAGQALDFTLYRRMSYFVHTPVLTGGNALADSLEFFFRVGTDTLNYYEIAHQSTFRPARVGPGTGWLEINVGLDQLTALKFPEDYARNYGAEAVVDTVLVGTQRVQQTSAFIKDSKFNDIPLRVTVRGAPSFQRVLRLFVGLRNRGTGRLIDGYVPGGPEASGEVWFDNIRLDDVERKRGYAQTFNASTKFGDVLDVSGTYQRRDGEFRALRDRMGQNLDTESWSGRASIADVSRVVPLLGFSVPVGYSYAWDRALPKFFNQSDTRNTEERKVEQRAEAVRTGYNFAVTKKPSQFWLNKVTLDRFAYSFSESEDKRRTYTTRDTSKTRQHSLTYDLSPRERSLPLTRRMRLNLMPTNFKFAINSGTGAAIGYNVLQVAGQDSLVRRPFVAQRNMSVNASTALRPLPILNVRYNYQEPRSFRRAHPLNEAERVTILGFDFGLPGAARTEGLSVDFTPRRLRLGANVNFGDNRTQQASPLDPTQPAPDVHNASSNRSARVGFDFAFHRRVLGWILPDKHERDARNPRPAGPQPGEPGAPFEPPPFDDQRPPPGAPPDSTGGSGREDLMPQSAPDPLLGSPPPEPEPEPPPPDSTFVPGSRLRPSPAALDSLRRKPPRVAPSPVAVVRGLVGGVLHALAGIEPIKVEYNVGQNLSYTGLPDAPWGPFRYGFSSYSGLVGSPRFQEPPLDDLRNGIELSSAVPLGGTLRMAVRYKRDNTVRRARSFGTVAGEERLTNINEDHRLDTTFPNLDLTINSIERVPLFRKKLDRSSVQLQFQHSYNETFRFDEAPGGPRVEGFGRTEGARTTATANWTGQWKRGVSSTLNVNQTNSNQAASGTKSDGVSRQAQASVRFKLAPAGGLKLPFMRGGLKSGMDVTLNTSVTTESRVRTNAGTKPIPEAATLAVTFGARGDYTLSRNMNGGVELGFTRQSRNDIQKQTVNTVRLGFNLTFLF